MAALGLGVGATVVIGIVLMAIFMAVYGIFLVYWIIPAGTEAAADRVMDRLEQSPIFIEKPINNGGI